MANSYLIFKKFIGQFGPHFYGGPNWPVIEVRMDQGSNCPQLRSELGPNWPRSKSSNVWISLTLTTIFLSFQTHLSCKTVNSNFVYSGFLHDTNVYFFGKMIENSNNNEEIVKKITQKMILPTLVLGRRVENGCRHNGNKPQLHLLDKSLYGKTSLFEL